MIGNIGNAVKGVGDKIKSFLHFSRPDEGPLRDYEKWMPDMIEGLSKTLNASAPQLYNASKELATKVAEGLDMSKMINDMKNIDTNIIPSKITSAMNISSSISDIQPQENIMEETFDKVMSRYQGNNNDSPINLTVNVNNKKLGQILLEDLRNMKRQTGNGLEALVGG